MTMLMMIATTMRRRKMEAGKAPAHRSSVRREGNGKAQSVYV